MLDAAAITVKSELPYQEAMYTYQLGYPIILLYQFQAGLFIISSRSRLLLIYHRNFISKPSTNRKGTEVGQTNHETLLLETTNIACQM